MDVQSTTETIQPTILSDQFRCPGTSALASPLLAIAPGPTLIERSSLSLPWQGVLLEKHLTSPGERKSAVISKNVITLVCRRNSRFEQRADSGKFVAHFNRAGTITVTPAGRIPEMRLQTITEFIHCALDEEFTNGVLNELDLRTSTVPVFRAGIQDKPIQQILGMFTEELESDRPPGRLYVDFLAHALATRYLMLDSGCKRPSSGSPVSALPTHILNRVRQKIEANIDSELSLEDLARESGYSRAHFLRMFRAATGLRPHRYVLELRLNRAKEPLIGKKWSLIDIALSCGFSSQSHLTSVFRQHFATTPAEFRRAELSSSAATESSLAQG